MLLATLWTAPLWYLLPVIVAVSLVYGATRHELPGPIFSHAWRAGAWMASFMLVIYGVIRGLSWLLIG